MTRVYYFYCGGSYRYSAATARAAARDWFRPSNYGTLLGFRLVRRCSQ